MKKPGRSLNRLIASLNPERRSGVFIFASLSEVDEVPPEQIEAMVREREGTTVVVTEEVAREHHLDSWFRAAWITLQTQSELADVGLTAAVSQALAKEKIPCNILAGARHDHVLVPASQADAALRCLGELQSQERRA